MKTTLSIISIFGILIIFSCNSKNEIEPNYYKYQLETDSCKSIQFLENEKIIIRNSCEKYSPNKSIMRQKRDGELLELFCFDTLNLVIDTIDSNNGKYISAYDRKGNRCRGLHIIDYDDVWIVTPLKEGKRIDDHFTEPRIYKKEDTKTDYSFDQNLIIKLSELPKEGLLYLAFNQKGNSNSKKESTGNHIIELQPNSINLKTDLDLNPAFYAFKKYKFQLLDKSTNTYSELSVLYHSEYKNYLKMTAIERQEFCNDKEISEKFVVVYRFNPGRERVIDKLYNEKIDGQVQPFEIVKV